MKKNYFSASIYAETLRRLRIFGFIVLSIYLVFQIFPPVYHFVEYTAHPEWYPSVNPIGVRALLAPLFALPYAVAPVMTLIAFFGFNRRNYSDFLHSLPYTRPCIFLSMMAAILTWVFALGIIAGGVNIGMYLMFPKLYAVSFAGLGSTLLHLAIMVCMVVAAIALGCSFTGTLLSNVAASGLILFLPRFLFTVVSQTVFSKLPFIVERRLLWIFSIENNLLFSYPLAVVRTGTLADTVTSCLYSFGVALLLGALACVFFCRRKSETAGQSAPHRIVQAGIRIGLTVVFSFLGTALLLTDEDNDLLMLVILLYLAALLTYFIYELISTLKWRNLLHILPGLGVVVLLNLLLAGAVTGISAASAAYRPAAEDIRSVRLIGDEAYEYYYEEFVSPGKYAEEQAQRIEIKDPAVIALVAQTLQDNMKTFDKGKYEDTYLYGSAYVYDSATQTDVPRWTGQIVAIRSGLTTKYRKVYFSVGAMQQLAAQLAELPEYREAYMELPDPLSGTEMIRWYGYHDEGMADWDPEPIFAAMREDVTDMGFEAWYLLSHSEAEDWSMKSPEVARLTYTADTRALTDVGIAIRRETMPKTFDALLAVQYAAKKDAEETQTALDFLRQHASDFEMYTYEIGFAHRDADGTVMRTEDMVLPMTDFWDNYIELSDEEKTALYADIVKLADGLENAKGQPTGEGYIYIHYYGEKYADMGEDWFSGYESYEGTVYFPLPEDFDSTAWDGWFDRYMDHWNDIQDW